MNSSDFVTALRLLADNAPMLRAVADIIEKDTAIGGAPATPPKPSVPPPPKRIEHFPGVFYAPDPDPTRGDIMEGQAPDALPLFRYVDAGYNVNSYGPINRKWKTNSMYAHIFGTKRSAIWDGSNGHDATPPQPGYSPAGWPIHYTLDGSAGRNAFGNPKGNVIGTGSLMYADKTFNNDDEVAAYIAAEAAAKPPAPSVTEPNFEMRSSYGSMTSLKADAEKFSNCVKVDGVPVDTSESKFGPCMEFVRMPSGTIVRGRYTPPAPGGDDTEVEI